MTGDGKPRQTSDKGTRVVQGGKGDPLGEGLEEAPESVVEEHGSRDPEEQRGEHEDSSEAATGKVPGKVLEPPS